MKKLYGITTAMVTPFDQNGMVLEEDIREMVDFLISRGIHCLYPCGTTGEMFLMSVEERKKVARTVVEQNNGRVTVYIHVGAMIPEETIALARHACEIGADGIGVVTPAFFGTNQDAMVAYYQKVLHSVPDDFPVYLYNIPQCAGNDLSCESVHKILDTCPNAVGIKYSQADMIRTYEYLELDEHFEVMQGTDRLFLPTLAMGCAGVVSGVSSVYPEPFVNVYNAWKAGDINQAQKWQRIANLFANALGAGSNMALFKAGLTHRGIHAGHMHEPQIDLTEFQIEKLLNRLTELEKLYLD